MTSPQIDIYTDMLCSYCALAKRLLKSKQVDFNEIEVSGDANLRAEMRSRANGQRTVPQIFIDDKYDVNVLKFESQSVLPSAITSNLIMQWLLVNLSQR